MNATELAIDGLAAQEAESLGACIGRGQTPDTYADIVEKLRMHCEKLPDHRKTFWSEQCKSIGVELFPQVTQVESLPADNSEQLADDLAEAARELPKKRKAKDE